MDSAEEKSRKGALNYFMAVSIKWLLNFK